MLLSAITHLWPKFWGGVAKMISSFEISTWINDYIPMKIVSSLIHVLIQYGLVNTKVYHGNLIITKEFPFSNWHDLVSGACSEIKWDSQRRSVAFQFRIFLSREAEMNHDDVIKWKHFPRYWPFVRRIRRSSVNPPPPPPPPPIYLNELFYMCFVYHSLLCIHTPSPNHQPTPTPPIPQYAWDICH